MQVEKRPGWASPTDVLERVFEGGVVIDPSDRVSEVPGPSLLQDTKSLGAELSIALLRAKRLRRLINAKRRALQAAVARTRKVRSAAAGTALQILIARCALEQARGRAAISLGLFSRGSKPQLF